MRETFAYARIFIIDVEVNLFIINFIGTDENLGRVSALLAFFPRCTS